MQTTFHRLETYPPTLTATKSLAAMIPSAIYLRMWTSPRKQIPSEKTHLTARIRRKTSLTISKRIQQTIKSRCSRILKSLLQERSTILPPMKRICWPTYFPEQANQNQVRLPQLLMIVNLPKENQAQVQLLI